MAIPPEPIAEVLPLADAVVLARVTRVLARAPQAPLALGERPGVTDAPGTLSAQTVELQIERVVHGTPGRVGQRLVVRKPEGDYLLAEGNHGPFLLRAAEEGGSAWEILGRYGPDSYRLEVIEATLQRPAAP